MHATWGKHGSICSIFELVGIEETINGRAIRTVAEQLEVLCKATGLKLSFEEVVDSGHTLLLGVSDAEVRCNIRHSKL